MIECLSFSDTSFLGCFGLVFSKGKDNCFYFDLRVALCKSSWMSLLANTGGLILLLGPDGHNDSLLEANLTVFLLMTGFITLGFMELSLSLLSDYKSWTESSSDNIFSSEVILDPSLPFCSWLLLIS